MKDRFFRYMSITSYIPRCKKCNVIIGHGRYYCEKCKASMKKFKDKGKYNEDYHCKFDLSDNN